MRLELLIELEQCAQRVSHRVRVEVQLTLQVAEPSQSSNAACTRPSPQYGALLHTLVHTVLPYAVARATFFAPSSQASLPFLSPSPQYGASVQSGLQVP